MAYQTFTDSTGVEWSAWEVRPQADSRSDGEGWLVFESASRHEKRRVSPIPVGWAKASAGELEAFRDRGAVAPYFPFRRAG
jgi:hypothetical protein